MASRAPATGFLPHAKCKTPSDPPPFTVLVRQSRYELFSVDHDHDPPHHLPLHLRYPLYRRALFIAEHRQEQLQSMMDAKNEMARSLRDLQL